MKTFQTVDMNKNVEYNYLENSLRIVCLYCDIITQCMSIFIYGFLYTDLVGVPGKNGV